MMTKKHYVAIAKTMAALRAAYCPENRPGHNIDAGYRQATTDVSEELATYFASENPRFDRARFLTACGLEG